MIKTETTGVYVMERSRAIEKIRQRNADKKNLSILSAVPFQGADNGWEVTFSYEEIPLYYCWCGGGRGVVESDMSGYFVMCTTCGHRQRESYESKETAMRVWNDRTDFFGDSATEYENLINNMAGFNGYHFQDGDYRPIEQIGRYTRDLRSIFLVADWNRWTDEELKVLDDYGEKFTAKYDGYFRIRLGANYIHVGRDNDGYCVKRDSWRMAKYPETFADLCLWLDKLLLS